MRKIIFLLGIAISFSFTWLGNPESSSWDMLSKKKKKQFEKSYAYIPSGKLMLEEQEEVSVSGFFMFKTEVTNINWKEFVSFVKKSGDKALLDRIQVANENWQNEAIGKLYYTHPAYNEYPVVNVSHEAAQEYCKWLEKMLAQVYEIPVSKISVRLPVKQEWMYAAQGGHKYAPYPWGGYYLRNAKGCYLANFNKAIGTHSITFNQDKGEYEVVDATQIPDMELTVPVTSFFPNDYELFNMSGNVAEMINDEGLAMGGSWNSTGYDIRISSEYKYEKPTPYVGFRPVVVFK